MTISYTHIIHVIIIYIYIYTQVCTLCKIRSFFWDPRWRIHGLCYRLSQWIRQWAHNIVQPRSLRRRQCLRQLISTLTRRVEADIHCCFVQPGTVTFGFLWTMHEKEREREAASRHCFWTCSRSKWRGGELPDWMNFFSWKDPSAEPWMVGSWTLWIFGQCQKPQQVTQGCALQWNCIKIYGQKCETNCLFLVAHILIEMVEARSWRKTLQLRKLWMSTSYMHHLCGRTIYSS